MPRAGFETTIPVFDSARTGNLSFYVLKIMNMMKARILVDISLTALFQLLQMETAYTKRTAADRTNVKTLLAFIHGYSRIS